VRLFTTGSTMPGQAHWLADEASYPAWEYAEANRISVCLQMTIAGIPMLRKLLEQFPKVRVLLDHLARTCRTARPIPRPSHCSTW
jgi:L-fuconolactonase